MKNYKLSRMNKRCEFGVYGDSGKVNPNFGTTIQEFVPSFTVYCGEYTATMIQSETLLGLKVDNTRQIVIRHNPKVNSKQLVHLDGTEYKIININSDDGINTFDVITLTEHQGIG